MFKPVPPIQSPGQILKLEIPLTVSIVLVLLVLGSTALFAWKPDLRPVIEFFGAASGVAAGILSAYYIGRGLKITIDQRDKALADDQTSKAIDFARHWNNPNFAQLRASWRALLEEVDGKTEDEVCTILEDHAKRTVAIDVLNFFEELSYAAKCGVADMETLREILGSILVRYFSAVYPWIERHRRNKHQPTFCEHMEWLRNEWKQNTTGR
jgi:hypothetical protein